MPDDHTAAIAATPLESRHGHGAREPVPDALKLAGNRNPGKFGRLFDLPGLTVPDAALMALAVAMKDALPQDHTGDNPDIPAGFTYLGQFVDHDITLDLTPLHEQLADPGAVENFRTPALDLDALYGAGPQIAPYMYQRDLVTAKVGPKLLVGPTADSPDAAFQNIPGIDGHDLPRTRHGRAVIGDERNDENLLVAQTHLAFIRFHNKVVDKLVAERPDLSGNALFEEARRIVTWHYQWIVLFDFVERLTEPGLVRRILHDGRRFYRFRSRPFIPVEFSVAAYRLGHSMVREVYDHNRVFNSGPVKLTEGTLDLLFFFTGKSGAIVGDLAGTPQMQAKFPPPLGPQAKLPSNWIIDWRLFYDVGGPPPAGLTRNAARKLDPFITPRLHELETGPGKPPAERNNLAFLNLKRGVKMKLPSGQAVARKMKLRVLTPDEIATGPDGAAAQAHHLLDETPLWFYILKEAQVLGGGTRLGPVGSTIVAETFVGLVHGDHNSFLWRAADWTPTLPSAVPGTFTMADMLAFTGDLSPIG
jgi:hypothetical protein